MVVVDSVTAPYGLEVDLDGRTAQLGMGGCGRIGVVEPPEPRNIAGKFDDPLIVDVVQHVPDVPGITGGRPWRPGFIALYCDYMETIGRNSSHIHRRPAR